MLNRSYVYAIRQGAKRTEKLIASQRAENRKVKEFANFRLSRRKQQGITPKIFCLAESQILNATQCFHGKH